MASKFVKGFFPSNHELNMEMLTRDYGLFSFLNPVIKKPIVKDFEWVIKPEQPDSEGNHG